MAREFRVVGPPGTGKTRYLTEQARRAVAVKGSDRVLVCSLTKAAAREAAGRDTGVDKHCVGTLHSLCYRALGSPKMVADEGLIDAWNEEHPSWRIENGYGSFEKGEGESEGDDLLHQLELMRSRCADREVWDPEVVAFSAAWEDFKQNVNALDFTDLIEQAPDLPPGGAKVLLVDEAQDHSALELRKLREWARHVETFVVVGDPYQALYGWRGADPEVFSGELHKVLGQSWRVPSAVQEAALRMIRRSADWREDIQYAPRAGEAGTVAYSTATWKEPGALLGDLRERGGMVLASCDFMLNPIKDLLRREGIPYHNPYTHRWNPLPHSVVDRVRALLYLCAPTWGGPEPLDLVWSLRDLRCVFAMFLTATSRDSDRGGVLRGAVEEANDLPENISATDLLRFAQERMTRPALVALTSGDLSGITVLLKKQAGLSLEYALNVMKRGGWSALVEEPRVILGTIHSVKGGESSHVTVFPDLSPAGRKQLLVSGWLGCDAIYRQFYVAMTRARSTLTLASRVPPPDVPFTSRFTMHPLARQRQGAVPW